MTFFCEHDFGYRKMQRVHSRFALLLAVFLRVYYYILGTIVFNYNVLFFVPLPYADIHCSYLGKFSNIIFQNSPWHLTTPSLRREINWAGTAC